MKTLLEYKGWRVDQHSGINEDFSYRISNKNGYWNWYYRHELIEHKFDDGIPGPIRRFIYNYLTMIE